MNLLCLIGKFLVDKVYLFLKLFLEAVMHCLKAYAQIWLLNLASALPVGYLTSMVCWVTSVEVWLCELDEGAEAGKVIFSNMAPTPAPREGRVLQGLHCFCCCMEHSRHKSSRTRTRCCQGKGDFDNACPKKGLLGFGTDRRREWHGNQLQN